MKRSPRSARRALAVAGALALGLLGTSCSAEKSATGTPEVVAAFYPLAWAAEQVVGDQAQVVNLTSPGGEPHDMELTPKATLQLTTADLLVYLPGFQPTLDDAATGRTEPTVTVDTVIEQRTTDSGEPDPHFWHDPLQLAAVVDAIAQQMSEIDPDHAGDYADRAAATHADLTALDEQFRSGLDGCARDVVVVSHDAFGYLQKYGIQVAPIAGLSPDAEPTPGDLARLRDLIASEGVTTVFSETLASPATAETLANEAGVTTAVLDPIEGLSDTTADEDYLSLMKANLDALREANGC